MTRLRRWLPAIAATLLLAGGSAVLTAGPAQATAGPQICNVQNTSLCANVYHGTHTPGDYVINYTNGDPNNTFEAIQLTGICGGGYVRGYNMGYCPWPQGSPLNNRYNGDAIVEFEDYTSALVYDPPLCIAASPTNSGAAILGTCSWTQNNYGWGGATGSVFILSGVKNFRNMGVSPFWAVNFHFSSSGGPCGLNNPAWMVGATKSAFVFLNSCTANNQWFQAP
jgi:hypothetical protein